MGEWRADSCRVDSAVARDRDAQRDALFRRPTWMVCRSVLLRSESRLHYFPQPTHHGSPWELRVLESATSAAQTGSFRFVRDRLPTGYHHYNVFPSGCGRFLFAELARRHADRVRALRLADCVRVR